MATSYDPKSIEPEILEFWSKNRIYEKAVKKNHGKKKFYFIDGPPYTTGAIHIGHAWNKSLKDMVLRYKRMKGFDAWSQPGFDMHGLPIEVAVEKKLGIKNKKEILEHLGVRKFIEECEKFAIDEMHPMIKDFTRMGVWMDWEKPYMSITNEYIEGAWWALSEADRNGYLYEGKKSMTWCPRCATALAKHELVYKNVNDKSVFVKLPVEGLEKTYLLVWTTTPWTLPFNLAVMAHPEFDYIKAHIRELGEDWILAKQLAKSVITDICGYTYEAKEEFRGEELEGMKYFTPFYEEMPERRHHQSENAYTVVMSVEYVDLSAGTGLVHTAPGCGPEDFEVGRRNGLSAYNTLDETGKFTEGAYEGLYAKKDDERFVNDLRQKGLLAAEMQVSHEYAHCWRCETAVIYRATDQWFLSVEKLRDDMQNENERVRWVPEWAGSRWFDSWLENLQDWCISRQRFWGIPLPIWKCGECGKTKLISTRKELPQKLENLHRPWIDEVLLKCGCGGEMRRVADVLDVWLDSGAASWAPLNYPSEEERFEKLWPADLILEGKDQIRGWFNSMICLSMVSFKRNSYKAVYMHGFVNDALGRKMSKSLKNIISPYEVIDKYGADTLRYYAIGGANPGFDLNYNFDDMKVKHKNLTVFWNLHNFLLDLAETAQLDGDKSLATEERYILSKLHTAIQKATYMMDNNYLNELPWMAEDLLIELSRTYIQLTREKASGSEEERNTVLHTAYTVFLEALKMLAPIAPFITEKMYQELKKKFDLQEESIHHHDWPTHDQELINEELEKEFEVAKSSIQAILSVREKIKQGTRWPLQEAIIAATGLETPEVIDAVKRQANVKEIKVVHKYEGAKTSVKADYDKLLPEFGSQKATRIIAALAMTAPETVLKYIERDGEFSLSIENEKVVLAQKHFTITKQAPHGYEWAEFDKGEVYVSIMTSPELEAEGYARELTRKMQNMRKLAGLNKQQRISAHINATEALVSALQSHAESIREKVGAEKLHLSTQPSVHTYTHSSKEKIRDKELWIGIDVV